MKTSYSQFIIPALSKFGIWSQIFHQSRSVSSTSMFMAPCNLQLEIRSCSWRL